MKARWTMPVLLFLMQTNPALAEDDLWELQQDAINTTLVVLVAAGIAVVLLLYLAIRFTFRGKRKDK